jgi:tRNA (cytidine56-2'-O)-methyltransferase
LVFLPGLGKVLTNSSGQFQRGFGPGLTAGWSGTTKRIAVLRIGQRYVRDDRTLTHLCLVARAFGAESITLEDAEYDTVRKVEEVNLNWGGDFRVEIERAWRKVIERARGEGRKVVHLTMYGMPLQDVVSELRGIDDMLVVVGGPKVPGEVYGLADYNVAVTSQPHSEVAALAVLLHEVQGGEELKRDFGKSRMKIIPSPKGKQVVRA